MDEKERLVNYYYEDNARRLRKLTYATFRKFGGISEKDHDDFYSYANLGFVEALKIWDGKQNFEALLQTIIGNKSKKLISKFNAYKRTGDRKAVSIDKSVDEDSELALKDILESNFDLDKEAGIEDEVYEKYKDYFGALTNIQTKILNLYMDGYKPGDIKRKLNMSDGEYAKHVNNLKSFEKIDLLYRNGIRSDAVHYDESENEENIEMQNPNIYRSEEKSKTKTYTVATLIKKYQEYKIRFDHPGQRYSGQWSPVTKGNFISDELQNNPFPHLIFAEEIIDGVYTIWGLDGFQRFSTCLDFSRDLFKVSPNVRRYMIPYQKNVVDENGNIVLSPKGIPMFETCEFDIRNKKFSQLPKELQDRFMEYNFEVTQYLNCTTEEIMYHIERYNDGKPMNNAQKSVIKLGGQFAEFVKDLTRMPFFTKHDNYTPTDRTKGMMERIVIEGIMASDFLDNWKSNPQAIGTWLRNNADETSFERMEENIEILEEIVTDDVRKLFTAKESFIWLGVFARFRETEEENERFVDFMAEFVQSLHSVEIDGLSYDNWYSNRCTKDKATVKGKIEHITALMNEFLGYVDLGEDTYEETDVIETEIVCEGNTKNEAEETTDTEEIVEETANTEEVSEEVAVNVSEDYIRLMYKKGIFAMASLKQKRKAILDALDIKRNGELTTLDMDDIDMAADCLEDYLKEADVNISSGLYSIFNLPGLLNTTIYMYEKEIDESEYIKWLSTLESNRIYEKFSGNSKERHNQLMKELGKYLSFRNISVA